jgi:allantoin racemase
MKLLYLDLSSLGLWDQRFQELLERAAAPETHVHVWHTQAMAGSRRTPYLPEYPEEYYSALLKSVRLAEEDGFDAVMLGCASEPGLRAARNAASIPIVGPLGAALHIGGLLGRRLSILCPAQGGQRTRPLSWHEESLRLYGVSNDLVTFRLVEVQKPDRSWVDSCVAAGDLEDLRRQMVEIYCASIRDSGITQAQRAVSEDRAEVVFFACTLWAGLLAPVEAAVNVPVLDPVVTLLKATESAVSAAGFCKAGQRHLSKEDKEKVINT